MRKGFACSLLNDDMDLIILNESTKEGTSDQLDVALKKHVDGAVLNNNYVTPAPSDNAFQPINKNTASLKFVEMKQWPSMETVSLDEEKIPASATTPSEPIRRDLALIIDGPTLTFALQDGLKEKLLRLGCMCKSVICCRVSPLQKAGT